MAPPQGAHSALSTRWTETCKGFAEGPAQGNQASIAQLGSHLWRIGRKRKLHKTGRRGSKIENRGVLRTNCANNVACCGYSCGYSWLRPASCGYSCGYFAGTFLCKKVPPEYPQEYPHETASQHKYAQEYPHKSGRQLELPHMYAQRLRLKHKFPQEYPHWPPRDHRLGGATFPSLGGTTHERRCGRAAVRMMNAGCVGGAPRWRLSASARHLRPPLEQSHAQHNPMTMVRAPMARRPTPLSKHISVKLPRPAPPTRLPGKGAHTPEAHRHLGTLLKPPGPQPSAHECAWQGTCGDPLSCIPRLPPPTTMRPKSRATGLVPLCAPDRQSPAPPEPSCIVCHARALCICHRTLASPSRTRCGAR